MGQQEQHPGSRQEAMQQGGDIQELDGYCGGGSCLAFSSLDDSSKEDLTLMYEPIQKMESVPSGPTFSRDNEQDYLPKDKRSQQFDSEYERVMKERQNIDNVGR